MSGDRSWTIRKPVLIGWTALTFLVAGVGTWSTQVEIAGAVLGSGQVEVESNKVLIQHLFGGVVEEIGVRNGDPVEAGGVLVRLDGTTLRTELNAVEGELFALLAKEARLEAQVDERHELDISALLGEQAASNAATRTAISREQRLLEAGYEEAARKADLLRKKIGQVAAQTAAVDAQMAAVEEQISVVNIDLANAERMITQNLVKAAHFSSVQQESAKLKGEAGRLEARRAELAEKSIELELELLSIEVDRRSRAVEELSKLQPIKIRLAEKRIDTLSRLADLEIKAPVSGSVHESQVWGRQSVIEAGKPIMWIVPVAQPAVAVVRIDAGDIEQVYPGQDTMLRFSSFNHRATPLVTGRTLTISADAILEPSTRTSYYEVRVAFSKEELMRLIGSDVVPGMPVEAYFTTETQTPFAYVTRPLVEYFKHAYRDT